CAGWNHGSFDLW
nr:immunoglobulin heavy chain junction region [Macaca mulatta]